MSLCAYGKWKQETWISFGGREKLCDGRRSSQWKRIFASPFLLTSIFSFYFRSVTLTEPFLSSFFLSFSSGLPCENFFAKQQQHLFIFLCTKLRLYRRGSSFFFRHNSSVMRRNCGSFISATDAPGILLLSVYFTFHSLFWLDFFSFFGILFHLLRSVRAYSKWLYKDKWIYQKLCVRCVCVCVLELTTCNCIFF